MQITLSIIFAMGIIAVFWWAMIESQTDLPGINEPNTYGSSNKDNNDERTG